MLPDLLAEKSNEVQDSRRECTGTIRYIRLHWYVPNALNSNAILTVANTCIVLLTGEAGTIPEQEVRGTRT